MTEPTLSGMLAAFPDARVLVVDDQPANTALIHRLLARAGITEVREVNDSREVQALLAEFDPDVVLLDLRMPHVDGFEVLRQVQRYAAGSYLPVMVITADDSRSSLQQALSMGAHDYLQKPFDATELTLRVRNVLMTRMAVLELRRSRALLNDRLDVFEPELSGLLEGPETVRASVAEVIASDSLRIALQPIVHMSDGRVYAYEALSRFPAEGYGSPAAWFLAADRAGVSVELERHAVVKALALLPAIPATSLLAINVSPKLLLSGQLPTLPPGRVILELTEHVPVEDYSALERALAPLRESGVYLAVDDTGAGFASLRHILYLKPNIIKLDLAIIRNIDQDPRRAAVARMMTQFAAGENAMVVAEGVETCEERDCLIDIGAVLGQGYFFARPAIIESADEGLQLLGSTSAARE